MAVGVGTGSHLHVITPGDHFSPATGSALPTVVHGLAGATPAGAPRSVVVVARGTYADRYPSADVVEYTAVAPRRTDRYRDAVSARVGLPRAATRRALAATLADQGRWPPSVVLGHNLPQLVPLVDGRRHAAVLYAHNELLRTYSVREAGRVLDGAGALVCVSDFVADRTADRLPARLRGRVRVVRNAVDTTLFRPADGVPPTEGPLRVVFVGRTVADKGPDVLVDALVRLRRTDVVATLVGTPHFAPGAPLTRYERELRAAAAPLGDSVRWLPFQPRAEVAALMRAADVVVVPSRWAEPFALTVLEGMASGAAVVAARVGGVPEAAGGAGLIVPPDSPGALAEALEGLADDRALLAEVRARGLRHARANDWSTARRRLDRALWDLGLTSAAPAGTSFR